MKVEGIPIHEIKYSTRNKSTSPYYLLYLTNSIALCPMVVMDSTSTVV